MMNEDGKRPRVENETISGDTTNTFEDVDAGRAQETPVQVQSQVLDLALPRARESSSASVRDSGCPGSVN